MDAWMGLLGAGGCVENTSVYLSDYKSLYSYGNNDIAIPLIVLEEIDKHKKRPKAPPLSLITCTHAHGITMYLF